ncbi:MAG: hypothetical protein IPK26_31605 [Planctomycetes bacterium]|nr:hypothetical protein [Planctomycetota bacterium]
MNDADADFVTDGALRVLHLPPPRAGLRELILAAGPPRSTAPATAWHRRRWLLASALVAASVFGVLWSVARGAAEPLVRQRHHACIEITGDRAMPFELTVGEIALRIAGTARIDFLPWPDDDNHDDTIMELPRLRTFLRDHATTPFFTLAVLAGQVTILGQQPVDLGNGQSRRVDQPVASDSAEAVATRAAWARVIAGEATEQETADELAAALVWRMMVRPGLFALVHDDLHGRFLAAERDGELAQRLLPFVVFDPAPWSDRVREVLLGSGDPAVLLAASERGDAAARAQLVALYLAQDPDDGEWLAVAAHLAAVGAKVDAARLRRTLLPGLEREFGLEPTVLVRTLTAAMALQALGDGAHLTALQKEVAATIDGMLRDGILADAAALLAVAEWFAEHGIAGRSQSIAWNLAVTQAAAERVRAAPPAGQIRRDLERGRWR